MTDNLETANISRIPLQYIYPKLNRYQYIATWLPGFKPNVPQMMRRLKKENAKWLLVPIRYVDVINIHEDKQHVAAFLQLETLYKVAEEERAKQSFQETTRNSVKKVENMMKK